VPKGGCCFQIFETPGPELLRPDVMRLSAILRVPTVTVPRIDGIENAYEAAIRASDFDDEGKVIFVETNGHFPFLARIWHGRTYSNKCGSADNVERLEERLERYHDLTEIRDQEIQGRGRQQPEAAEHGEREKLGSFD
jgi:hypothetical protein